MIDQNVQAYICEIRTILKTIAEHCNTQKKWNASGYWTEKIFRCIGAAGKRQGFEVYSKFHPNKYNKYLDYKRKEWSFDLCWIEEHDSAAKTDSSTLMTKTSG